MKVLVTGCAGYIGSVLVRQLLSKNYYVRGLDNLNFGGESLLGIFTNRNFQFLKGDIRNKSMLKTAISDIDSVIHFAAIVGDPACAEQPQLAKETNEIASLELFDLCISTKCVKRFIFASTCSNYGKMMDEEYLREDSPLRPVSHYAKLKVNFEKHILENTPKDNFYPTALRFATAYGVSARMRFDLTINEFVRDLTFGKELAVFGEQFWRPYCNVEDIAKACTSVLESRPEIVSHNVYNVGDTKENYQKKMIVDEIQKIIPEASIKYVTKEDDPRDYKVDFSKIRDQLNFKIENRVPDGINDIYKLLKDGILDDPFSAKFRNSK